MVTSPRERRILVTGPALAPEASDLMAARACRWEASDDYGGPDALVDRLRAFAPDGLIVRTGNVNREVLAASRSLRVVCKHGVGVDNIDVEAATALGVPVLRTPSANTEPVAEHALALLLALARRIPEQDRETRGGAWPRRGYPGMELAGKTLGLVGFGRIARRLAELAAPFRMPLVIYRRRWSPESLPPGATQVRSLHELMARADVISLHCSLEPGTRHLIGRAELEAAKRGALLINTGRGGLVDEEALLDALRRGLLGGAALDVFEQEPLSGGRPLMALPNVIATSHVAAFSPESTVRMGLEAVRNVLLVLDGGRPDEEAIVNPAALEARA
jgi:D-3-phosphoglycerate dehydrogenase